MFYTSILGPIFGYYNLWMIQFGLPGVGIALLAIFLFLRISEKRGYLNGQ